MESELSKELLDTLVGMRNAGADRAAVVQRLQDEGISHAVATAVVDRIDAQNALRHGARPADMRADIASRADAAREANLAATGLEPQTPVTPEPLIAADATPAMAGQLAPSAETPLVDGNAQPIAQRAPATEVSPIVRPASSAPAKQLDAATEAKLASEGHVLLLAGMAQTALKQQWLSSGFSEEASQRLVDAAQAITKKNEEKKQDARRRTPKLAVGFMAVLGVMGIIGILVMLQGPTGQEQASAITQAACGTQDARVFETAGQVVLMAGEALDVAGSVGVLEEGFNDIFMNDGDVQPDHVLCSTVSLAPVEYCDGYRDVPDPSNPFRLEPSDALRSVQIRGSALIVTMFEIDSYDQVEFARIEVGSGNCPLVHRGNGIQTRRPDREVGLAAITELVPRA